MGFRLARVPLVEFDHTLTIGGTDITLRTNQPVVWVRLVPWAGSTTEAVAFPAVVDTGNNHSFLIPGPLFRVWAGQDLDSLTPTRTLSTVNGHAVSCYGFNLELLRLSEDGGPVERVAARLQTGQGVAVVPDSLAAHFPRLPVLGVRCLIVNRTRFALDGDMRTFSLTQASVPRIRRPS